MTTSTTAVVVPVFPPPPDDQDQAMLRWIMGDVEDPSIRSKKMLNSGSFSGRFGVIDQSFMSHLHLHLRNSFLRGKTELVGFFDVIILATS
ncbi:hypothetical protein Tco_0358920 [Tanacetum coccineum]